MKLLACLIFLVLSFHGLSQSNQIDSLKELVKNHPSDIKGAQALSDLSHQYGRTDLDTAIYYANKAIDLSTKLELKSNLSRGYNVLANALANAGKKEEALIAYQKAINIRKETPDVMGVYQIQENLGSFYLKIGRIKKANEMFRELSKKYSAIGDTARLANTLNSLALGLSYLDKYHESGKTYLKALKCYQLLGKKYNMGVIYLNLSTLSLKADRTDYALEFAKSAHQIFSELDKLYEIGVVEGALGNIYLTTEEFENAEKHYEISIEIGYEINDLYGLGKRLVNLGSMYLTTNENDKAFEYYNKALQILNKSSSQLDLGNCLSNLGVLYLNKGQVDSAIYFCEEAKPIFQNVGAAVPLMNCYTTLHESYAKKKQFDLAYTYQFKADSIEDSLYNKEKVQAVEELYVKYESDEKQAKLDQLKIENELNKAKARQTKLILWVVGLGVAILIVLAVFWIRIRHQKQKQRQLELEQQVFRSQMNPHFIFNCFNSIQRLFMEGKTEIAGDYMADFATLMRSTLENSDAKLIALNEELELLEVYLDLEKLRSHDGFDYYIQIDKNVDIVNEKVPPLIIQPFVENAIWHGILPKDEKGEINVFISKKTDDDSLQIIIEDDGVGFNRNVSSEHESKGIEISEKRIKKQIKIKSEVNIGTRIEINL